MFKRYKYFLLLMLSVCLTHTYGQYFRSERLRTFAVKSDTLKLDSLSLIKESVNITYFSVNDSLKKPEINYPMHALIFKNGRPDSILVSYRVFPFNFEQLYFHKDASQLYTDLSMPERPFTIKYEKNNSYSSNLLKNDGLTKNGNISRGVSVGNNQDAVLNSNLNLQVSGKLTPEIDILMAATDNNIPFQADGTTAQLQEFDKVFVQLNNESTKLVVGDYQLSRPQSSYFMNFYKRAQGISLDNVYLDSTNNKPVTFKTQVAGAISRGKFSRMVFFGIENNQGPYRLRGADNEPFIIVLSGTEKIYIDGKLLLRGQENDYIIDYNTGELTFTARQQITKDKRIVAEFQYAERNYARSLFLFSEEIQGKKAMAYFNFFSEQDNKNRALQQTLSQDQKLALAQVGDTLEKAYTSGATLATFNNSDVFYLKRDSIVNSVIHTIYVYSTNPDSAQYLVKFSNVGTGKGNYIQVASAANGRVYKWIAPVNNVPQGSFEPLIPLVSPKQSQMFTAGFNYSLTNQNSLQVEGVYTKNDINTFSLANKGNDEGSGVKVLSKNQTQLQKDSLGNTSKFVYNINYEFVQKNFKQIERFRSIEFDRDWNRPLTGTIFNDQHIGNVELGFVRTKGLSSIYQFNNFMEGNSYQGIRHNLLNRYNSKNFNGQYSGSYLTSNDKITSTTFYRHKTFAYQKLGKVKLGYVDDFENNKFVLDSTKRFTPRTYQFWEWEGSISSADSSMNFMKLFYKERRDKQAYNNEVKDSTMATNIGFQATINSIKNNPFSVYITYRQLNLKNTISSILKPDNTFLNRLEYNPRWFKGLLTMGIFYETGYGLENKREYYYIEVAPGQGQFSWLDYNADNIKQLNEFEIAQFTDQAKYIRIYAPTNQYVKVLQNQLSANVNIRPIALLREKKTAGAKFIGRFALQTAYRIDNKTMDNGELYYFNPFLNIDDTLMIANTTNFRQSFFFNQSSSVVGGDYTYINNASKQLLNNGIETRLLETHEVKWRLNFAKWFSLNSTGLMGIKGNHSLLFSSRNYLLHTLETEQKLSYQPGTTFRISILYKYGEKANTYAEGFQRAFIHNAGLELKYNQTEKGSFNMRIDLLQMRYNDVGSSAIAFEMLNGLANGTNYTWEILYQRNINSNLQISVNYNGRKSASSSSIVHLGGGTIRAFF